MLAWCAEFEELVSEVKKLGFSGEMAAQTRECALEACHEVLQLDLDIYAQLILMYLARIFFPARALHGILMIFIMYRRGKSLDYE